MATETQSDNLIHFPSKSSEGTSVSETEDGFYLKVADHGPHLRASKRIASLAKTIKEMLSAKPD